MMGHPFELLGHRPRSAWLPKLAIGFFAILVLSGVVVTTNVGAGETVTRPVVRIELDTQHVLAGDSVVIDITVTDVIGLGAYEFELHYDPLVLTFVSVTNGPFLGSDNGDGTNREVLDPCAKTQFAGVVRFGCNTIGTPPPDGPSGSGILATLKFTTSFPGVSQLTFTRAGLSTTLGKKMERDIFGGQVTVKGPTSTPTPTITPTPTDTAIPAETDTPTNTATPQDANTPTNTPATAGSTTTPEGTPPTATTTSETATATSTSVGPTSTNTPSTGTATDTPTQTRPPSTGTPGTPGPGGTATATSVGPTSTNTPSLGPATNTPPVVPPTATPPSGGTVTDTPVPATLTDTPPGGGGGLETPTPGGGGLETPTPPGGGGGVGPPPIPPVAGTGPSSPPEGNWIALSVAALALALALFLIGSAQTLWWRRRQPLVAQGFTPAFRFAVEKNRRLAPCAHTTFSEMSIESVAWKHAHSTQECLAADRNTEP